MLKRHKEKFKTGLIHSADDFKKKAHNLLEEFEVKGTLLSLCLDPVFQSLSPPGRGGQGRAEEGRCRGGLEPGGLSATPLALWLEGSSLAQGISSFLIPTPMSHPFRILKQRLAVFAKSSHLAFRARVPSCFPSLVGGGSGIFTKT